MIIFIYGIYYIPTPEKNIRNVKKCSSSADGEEKNS